MSHPDLLSLRLFLSVFELGNISRAAARHHTVPSSVSKRISELEEHYGVHLFQRRAKGVVATHAAEELARHARDLLLVLQRAGEAMDGFAQGEAGRVRVAATTSVLAAFLVDGIAEFAAAYPGIGITLLEDRSYANLASLLDGQADLAFVSASVDVPPFLQTRLVRGDRLTVIAPATHPTALTSPHKVVRAEC